MHNKLRLHSFLYLQLKFKKNPVDDDHSQPAKECSINERQDCVAVTVSDTSPFIVKHNWCPV